MHDTVVKMKDGRKFIGGIWTFKPTEGFLTLIGIDETLYFKDMESAVTYGERLSVSKIGDQDEIERAKKYGWDGKK
jgi:hypothetical protein